MKSTRDQIRDLLAAHGEMTVADVAAALGMNQANIRRHLEALRIDELVDVTFRRHVVGRPSYLYRLTERGEAQTAHYPRLVDRLVRQMAALPEGGGAMLLEQVFEGVAEDVAGSLRGKVTGASLEERIAQTSDALRDEGIVDHWHKEADGFHLMNSACPYRRAAEVTDAPCHADQKTVQLLVGAPVEQVTRMVDGHAMCEYVVRANAAPAEERQAHKARGHAAPR